MTLLVEGGGGLSGKHFPLLSTSNPASTSSCTNFILFSDPVDYK